MESGEVAAFLAATQKYSIGEAFTEVASLVSGEWDSMQVSDAAGTVYQITYDTGSGLFQVTDNPVRS